MGPEAPSGIHCIALHCIAAFGDLSLYQSFLDGDHGGWTGFQPLKCRLLSGERIWCSLNTATCISEAGEYRVVLVFES